MATAFPALRINLDHKLWQACLGALVILHGVLLAQIWSIQALWIAKMLAGLPGGLVAAVMSPLLILACRRHPLAWFVVAGMGITAVFALLVTFTFRHEVSFCLIIGYYILWIGTVAMSRVRAATGTCRVCGYDLRATAGGTCPECGTIAAGSPGTGYVDRLDRPLIVLAVPFVVVLLAWMVLKLVR